MSESKLVGYVITDSNVSPCGTKLSYGAKDQYQLWEVWEITYKNGKTDLEFYCSETNVDESEYGKEYKNLPLFRNWECDIYRELL